MVIRPTLGLSDAGQDPAAARPGQSFPFLAPNWAAMMMGPFAPALLAGADPRAEPGDQDSDVRKAIEDLRQQVDALRKELKSGQDDRATGLCTANGQK